MSFLLPLATWSFLPDYAANAVLNFIYSTPAAHSLLRITPTPRGSPQHRRHYGFTFAIIILGYLLYTMISSALSAPLNFYETLGVPHTVDAPGLTKAFRQFARTHHPDRPDIGAKGADLFIYVRDVYEALKDPATRFAYDRFGPDALKWRNICANEREFLRQGLLASLGYHIFSLITLLFFSVVGQPSPVSFWRYILFVALFAAELVLIVSPSPEQGGALASRHSTIFSYIFPNRVPYQHVLFLHQLFMFMSVAVTRVAPHLIPYNELDDTRVQQTLLQHTSTLLNVVDRETSKIVHTDLQSIASEEPPSIQTSPVPRYPTFARLEPVTPGTATQVLTELAPEMEQLMLEANLKKSSGPLKTAWEAAVARAFKRRGEEEKERRRALRALEEEEEKKRQEEARREEEERERARSSAYAMGQSSHLHSPQGSRETTPTASSPSPHVSHSHPHRAREQTPGPASAPSSPRVKQEEEDYEFGLNGSGYFVVSSGSSTAHTLSTSTSNTLSNSNSYASSNTLSSPASPFHTLAYSTPTKQRIITTPTPYSTPDRSFVQPQGGAVVRSAVNSGGGYGYGAPPRTPGELPSPRPSPSPPPSTTPRSHPIPHAPHVHRVPNGTHSPNGRWRRGSSARQTGEEANSFGGALLRTAGDGGSVLYNMDGTTPPAHAHGQGQARGYFAKGTAQDEDRDRDGAVALRARSVSC
ncbi:hypothetical protein FA15DRAFT_667614 [Coprinopsis marcescibilis]|uniref:J domain-containing protein n=1 Tax=Coprinopsis marcescibilis TaxID=230819 RepID=A0A5C3L083_COPMA|nr:hypothetical protein FA15DRAFT_667614 [Coprinopsis marcescibilis]